MKKHKQLYTKEFNNLDFNSILPEYALPNLKRKNYLSLNGKWKFKVTKNIFDLTNINNDINVPFPIESFASNACFRLKKNEHIIYKKEFTLDKNFLKEKTFITFLGVDQKFILIVNDYKFGEIIPLGVPVEIDISEHVKETNTIYVIVTDNIDYKLPIGKQNKRPRNIFYTPYSGIYYPVFITSVNNDFIESINIKTNTDTLYLDIVSSCDVFNIIINDNGKLIINETTNQKNNIIKIPNPINWSTNNPYLYELTIKTQSDEVSSYFGLRTIEIMNDKFYLNNEEIFLNGLLYQGYYPDGISTPVSYDTVEKDIKLIKELGFNTLRVHVKVESPYFYYLCDKYGLLLLQDFISSGKYHFLTQTALPTIGLLKRNDKNMNKNKIQREMFIKCGERIVNYLSNHPSVIGYTIFNEAWGQFDSDNVYRHFKSMDPNLIFNAVSGWFIQKESDLIGLHLYFKNLDKLKTLDETILLSEFGALCLKVDKHSYSNKNTFAYTYFSSKEDLTNAYINMYEKQIIPYKDKLSGLIYTQFVDVEEEDNGLITFDRKVLKINKEVIQSINNKLK